MEEEKKVTFELSDLSYEELINSFLEIKEFMQHLDDLIENFNSKEEEEKKGE